MVSPPQGSLGTLWRPLCWFRIRVSAHGITCRLPQSGLDYFVYIWLPARPYEFGSSVCVYIGLIQSQTL